MTSPFDLCLSWNWEHDGAFLELLRHAFAQAGLSLLEATPASLGSIVEALGRGQLGFKVLLDRASEDDERFLALVKWARDHGAHSINEYESASLTWNKARMHRVIFAEVHTPYTIILPPYREEPELAEVDLSPLRGSFTIKPASGGGGAGVVVSAETLEQVRATRREFPDCEYLVQTRVMPARLGGRDAWFRVLYCCGEVYPCWWATDSHLYTPVTLADEAHYHLAPLRQITERVARICRLQLFSSEIALSAEGEFLVVDYANDPIDLRLQSRCAEGVPDQIVSFIVDNLATLAAARRARCSAA